MNNLEEIADFFYPHVIHEKRFLTKIFEILRTCECSKNLMVVIYLIEEDKFFFCNQAFRSFVGSKSQTVLKEGWEYWFSLITMEERYWIRESLSNFFTFPYIKRPLALRYHIKDTNDKNIWIQHELRVRKLDNCALALNYFSDISEKEKIEHYFSNQSEKYPQSKKDSHCSISKREKEVLKLIGEGYSSKQIADKLYISNHTAISHRKNLIEKFQVKNTAHLIKRALDLMHL